MTTLYIKLDQPQDAPAGFLIWKMYYNGFLESVLKTDEYSGYPHNGGYHTLCLYLSLQDARSFLDLVEMTFSEKYPEEVAGFVSVMSSKLLTSQIGVNKIIQSR